MARLHPEYIRYKGSIDEIDARNENIYTVEDTGICDVCGASTPILITMLGAAAIQLCRGCAIKAAMFAIGEAQDLFYDADCIYLGKEHKRMILPCSCQNAYQDSLYGKDKRVHNPCKPTLPQKTWRCTVCGVEKVGVGTSQTIK